MPPALASTDPTDANLLDAYSTAVSGVAERVGRLSARWPMTAKASAPAS
jgi:hypothetical protein